MGLDATGMKENKPATERGSKAKKGNWLRHSHRAPTTRLLRLRLRLETLDRNHPLETEICIVIGEQAKPAPWISGKEPIETWFKMDLAIDVAYIRVPLYPLVLYVSMPVHRFGTRGLKLLTRHLIGR